VVLSNVFINKVKTLRGCIRPSRESEGVGVSTAVLVDLGDDPVIPINDLQTDGTGRRLHSDCTGKECVTAPRVTCDSTRLDWFRTAGRDGHRPAQHRSMPTKRKVSDTHNVDEPIATRRRTRSKAASSPISSPPRNPLSRVVHASPSTARSPARTPPDSAAFSTPTKKNSDKRLTRSQSKASAVVHSKPPPSGVRSSERKDDDRSEDELLLGKVAIRKRPETVSSKVSRLPRVFVEIVSPAPRTPKHLTAKAVAGPSSPTPNRSRVVQKFSLSPPPSRTSPTKATTTKRMRPSRPLVQQPARQAGQSSPPHSPSRYPPSCLHAQKRAILHALQYPKTAVFDEGDENCEPSANAVALEQLRALLTGTLERGEGNSCLLIGPRGSGKSRVSVCLPVISPV
jgi:origin recognition complex subunit 4